jgi:hypothetical protein
MTGRDLPQRTVMGRVMTESIIPKIPLVPRPEKPRRSGKDSRRHGQGPAGAVQLAVY